MPKTNLTGLEVFGKAVKGALRGPAAGIADYVSWAKSKDGKDSPPSDDLANLEQLDPSTQAQMNRAVASARGLRGRPLVSGMLAKKMGDDAAKRQFAAMRGAPPESQFAAAQKGATLGGTILQQQGGTMAREAKQRFDVGLRVSRARSQLESGQAVHALAERLKELAHKKGIQLNDSMAMQQAWVATVAMAADVFSGEKGKE